MIEWTKKVRYIMKTCGKKVFLVVIAIITSALRCNVAPISCKVSLEPLWFELDQNDDSQKLFGGKWIVSGKITFSYKTKEHIKLEKLQLNWNGEPIEYVLGTLYKADADDKFLPIESYVICDSNWNRSRQTMSLNFAKPYLLDPISTFYLVLTVPEHLEKNLKNGIFSMAAETLPRAFRSYANNNPLSLTLGEHSQHKTPIKTIATSSPRTLHS